MVYFHLLFYSFQEFEVQVVLVAIKETFVVGEDKVSGIVAPPDAFQPNVVLVPTFSMGASPHAQILMPWPESTATRIQTVMNLRMKQVGSVCISNSIHLYEYMLQLGVDKCASCQLLCCLQGARPLLLWSSSSLKTSYCLIKMASAADPDDEDQHAKLASSQARFQGTTEVLMNANNHWKLVVQIPVWVQHIQLPAYFVNIGATSTWNSPRSKGSKMLKNPSCWELGSWKKMGTRVYNMVCIISKLLHL